MEDLFCKQAFWYSLQVNKAYIHTDSHRTNISPQLSLSLTTQGKDFICSEDIVMIHRTFFGSIFQSNKLKESLAWIILLVESMPISWEFS